MLFVSVLRNALLILVPLSITLTSYLYLYPVFHLCAFPSPGQDAISSYLDIIPQHVPLLHHKPTSVAPFRLLALGDPQLEGDTSLNRNAKSFPNFSKFWKDALLLEGRRHGLLQRIRLSLHDLVDFYFEDIPNILEYCRKRIDLVGNDYYLAHIYRTLHWWTKPTHVSVLGDLLGSQWISDEEFETRGQRYWDRVFKHGKRVEDEMAFQHSESEGECQAMVLGEDEAWDRRIINIAGNHDIGYAGDLSPERLLRFERTFGKANYELRFQLPEENLSHRLDANSSVIDTGKVEEKPRPELRIVVLNDMNLDSPVLSQSLQEETYSFLNKVITASQPVTQPAHFTLILTHIPLYKPSGVCIDGPFFTYHHDPSLGSGIREQNHLSRDASKGFLEGLLGMSGDTSVDGGGRGRKGLIINGHDHEGCDVWHFINQTAVESGDSGGSPDEVVTVPVESGDSGSPRDEVVTVPIEETETAIEVEVETETETEMETVKETKKETETSALGIETNLELDIAISIALTPDSSSSPSPPTTAQDQTTQLSPPTWQVLPYLQALSSSIPSPSPTASIPGTREITLRSMMGDFGGSAGLLSLWFDESSWEWKYEFETCALGAQHIWWVVHIVDVITLGVGVVWLVFVGVVTGWRKVGGGKREVKGRGVNGVGGKGTDGKVMVGNGSGKRSHALRKKKSRSLLRDGGL